MDPNKSKAYLNVSDEEIWRDFKDGHEDAFIWIYESNFPALFRYGSQFTLDKALIEDTIQDLFIGLKTNVSNLGMVRSIKAYLFVSFRRLILRYKKRTTWDVSEGHNFELVPPLEKTIIDAEYEAEKKADLQQALSQLTKRQKEAIYYFYFENMSYEEVSQVMDFDHVKSTRNLIYETLKKLRESMVYLSFLLIRFS